MVQLSDIPPNASVRWSGTRFGLIPTISEAAEELLDDRQALVPLLLAAMNDRDHFVTAHVLLTKAAGIAYETFPAWNGLEVDLQASGETRVDPDQRYRLAGRWDKFFRTEPRPNALPLLP
jgi:hypothetical protein